jgi:mannose-6-phosphate isomerase-like protein (cupin superfamily)
MTAGAAIAVVLTGAAGPKSADIPLAARVRHLSQAAVDKTPWGTLCWLMNAQIDPEAAMTVGLAENLPNISAPMHVHANSEEVIHILSGSCEQRMGNETVILKAGDTLRIPAGVPHCAKGLGAEPSRAVVVYNTGHRQFAVVK